MTLHEVNGNDYETFKKKISSSGCCRCELSRSRTHIVVDRGNPDSKVVIIGEAPGKNEDLAEKAFVGRSGKLLDQMMQAEGFDPNQDSLIMNVVKCRPPQNRPPKPAEVEACSAFFKEQLALVHPKIIVLLGRTALQHVLPEMKNLSMKDHAGRQLDHPAYPGVHLFILYHPAYILRDPRKKSEMADHIRNVVADWKKLS